MSSKNCRIAAIQMVSGPRVADNLATAGRLIDDAVAQGAQLVVLPEYFPIIGAADIDRVNAREDFGHGPIQSWLAHLARAHGARARHLDFCRFHPVDRDSAGADAQQHAGLQSSRRMRRALRQS
ncbi:MAG: nitrilase-related carbon-nitrogen hydrolase, partial [Betaproteobacteria bacterium]